MLTKVQRWGNSLGLRIPQNLAKETSVQEGSVVEIVAKGGQLIVRRLRPKKKKYALRDLVKRIRPENVHREVSFGPARGKEVW